MFIFCLEMVSGRAFLAARNPRAGQGPLDHGVPHSHGGADTWENLVWSAKDVNQLKADRLPHEAGLRLLTVPRTPKELPVTETLRNAHGVAEWQLFLKA